MKTTALLLALVGPLASACLPALAEEPRIVVQGCAPAPTGTSGAPAATYVQPPDCGKLPRTLELAPGAEASWEAGGVPPFAAALGGPIEVTLADGSKQQIRENMLIRDVDQWRKVRNPGKKPVHLVLSPTPFIDIVPAAPKAR